MKPLPHPLAPEARAVTPRDLAWLVGSLMLVVLPHALRIPWWLTLLTMCLYAWRVYLAVDRSPLPARWLLIAVAAVAMFGVWLEYRTLFGRGPGIVLLVLFSGLKLLETRHHRDAAIAAFLGYFLIVTNFLYTQSIPTAAGMCLALFAITTTLVGFSAPQRTYRANLRSAGLLLAHAAPIALALFVLFPRIQGPLWGLPQDANAATTGLSDTMSPGNVASLAQSDAIAFRAEFETDAPPPNLRYWRGPVLWDFDGRTWRAGHPYVVNFSRPAGRGVYHYRIVLEPHHRPWLFALETAATVPPRAYATADGQLLARQPVRGRMQYEMASIVAPEAVAQESPHLLQRARRLPAGFNPRAVELADRWRRDSRSDAEVVARALAFLKESGFKYTLEPPPLGRDSVDEFLFDTRTGFCEHFSSAFTFLMRAAGIPARVVTGYQGGDVNTVDNHITVRQWDAHAWSEIFLEGRGWLRVDPTAVAVPGRVQSGMARAVSNEGSLPLMMQPQMEWLISLRHHWEAYAHRWNVWVLGYNPDRQRHLMNHLGMRNADWRSLTVALFIVLGLITLGLLAWSLRRLSRPDPVQKIWEAFCTKLAAQGVGRAPHEGPRDYTTRAARALPRSRGPILRIGAQYIGLRYGAHASKKGVARLRRMVKELHFA